MQHVHNSLRIWKRLYVRCKTIPQPLQHVHNKLTIDTQQTNDNTHNKAIIPATITTGLRLLYHNKSTTGSQQDDFIWKPGLTRQLSRRQKIKPRHGPGQTYKHCLTKPFKFCLSSMLVRLATTTKNIASQAHFACKCNFFILFKNIFLLVSQAHVCIMDTFVLDMQKFKCSPNNACERPKVRDRGYLPHLHTGVCVEKVKFKPKNTGSLKILLQKYWYAPYFPLKSMGSKLF